ncbi:hypothetical protein ACX84Z_20260, partial [Burkholderia pseudomallei]
ATRRPGAPRAARSASDCRATMGADDVAHIVGRRLDTPDLPHRRLALLDRERIRGGGRRRRGRFRMTDDG